MTRVCHVLCSLNRGGIECWLRDVVNQAHRIAPGQFGFDFVTLLNRGGELEDALRGNGCNVDYIPLVWKNIASSILALARYFRHRHYDVVHCHADFLGGVVLFAAMIARVPVRVNHVHTTRFAFAGKKGLYLEMGGLLLRWLSLACADIHLGCSRAALVAFNKRWRKGCRHQVHYCGISLHRFAGVCTLSQEVARQTVGVPSPGPYLIHVGRHAEEKNIGFLLRVLAALAGGIEGVKLLLVGEGQLTKVLRQEAAVLGLSDRVNFLGARNEVPILLRSADLFVLPSLHEGLPVSLLEAQACGLPCLIADHITNEADCVTRLVERMPLSDGVSAWAGKMRQLLSRPSWDSVECLERVRHSPFNLESGTRQLLELYRELLKDSCLQ